MPTNGPTSEGLAGPSRRAGESISTGRAALLHRYQRAAATALVLDTARRVQAASPANSSLVAGMRELVEKRGHANGNTPAMGTPNPRAGQLSLADGMRQLVERQTRTRS